MLPSGHGLLAVDAYDAMAQLQAAGVPAVSARRPRIADRDPQLRRRSIGWWR